MVLNDYVIVAIPGFGEAVSRKAEAEFAIRSRDGLQQRALALA